MKIRMSLVLEKGDKAQDMSFDMPDGSAVLLTPKAATVDVAPESFFKSEKDAEKHAEKHAGRKGF
jgi:hypothetical protein